MTTPARTERTRPAVIKKTASELTRGDWVHLDSASTLPVLIVAAFTFGNLTALQSPSGQWMLDPATELVWTGHHELPLLAAPATPAQATAANPFWDRIEELHARESAIHEDFPPLPPKPTGDPDLPPPPLPTSPPPTNATVALDGTVVEPAP